MSGSITGGLMGAYGGMGVSPQQQQQMQANRAFPYRFLNQNAASNPAMMAQAPAPPPPAAAPQGALGPNGMGMVGMPDAAQPGLPMAGQPMQGGAPMQGQMPNAPMQPPPSPYAQQPGQPPQRPAAGLGAATGQWGSPSTAPAASATAQQGGYGIAPGFADGGVPDISTYQPDASGGGYGYGGMSGVGGYGYGGASGSSSPAGAAPSGGQGGAVGPAAAPGAGAMSGASTGYGPGGFGPGGSMTGAYGSVGGPNVGGTLGGFAGGLLGGMAGTAIAGPAGGMAAGYGGKQGGTYLGNLAGNAFGLGTTTSFGLDPQQVTAGQYTAGPNGTPTSVSQAVESQLATGSPTATHDFIVGAPAAYNGPNDIMPGTAEAAAGGTGGGGGLGSAGDVTSGLGGLYAGGGGVDAQGGLAPGVVRPDSGTHFLRDLARGSGLVKGITGGAADRVHTSVPGGSYVMPADVVSGLGQGNTTNGARFMTHMLGAASSRGAPHLAGGGRVPVRLSAGEFVVHPKHAAAIGGGSLARGHATLDGVVKQVRLHVAHRALTTPPPR